MKNRLLFVFVILSLINTQTGLAAAKKTAEALEGDVINQVNQSLEVTKIGELNNKPHRLEWLQDNGFGMFIHWGVDAQLGCVISHSLVGASDDYIKRFREELPKTFNPKQWDPEFYVMLAKTCGMKYVVLGAKHCSGFCLWDTKTTNFNIMNTPYRRDIVREFVEACRKYDMAVGLYYSPEDWLYSYDRGETIRRYGHRPNPNSDPEYVKFIKAQVTELMSDYGDVDVFFIDGAGKRAVKEVVWTMQPDCLITRGAMKSPEQTVPGIPPKGAWESCITLGTQWQYKPQQLDNLKSGARVIKILVETRAKGGALLLNIGPRPDGSFNELQEDILREVGLWNFAYRDAIINTRPWIVTNEDNIWFTKSKDEDTVFAILTKQGEWHRKKRREFVIRSVEATENTQISVLGHNGKVVEYSRLKPDEVEPRFEQREDGLHISVLRGLRFMCDGKWENPVVVKLTNVKPSCQPPQVINGKSSSKDGTITFRGELKSLGDAKSVKVGFEYQVYAGFHENMYNDKWESTELIIANKPGPFQMNVKVPKGKTYQWRAVVEHPKVKMTGDHSKVTVR